MRNILAAIVLFASTNLAISQSSLDGLFINARIGGSVGLGTYGKTGPYNAEERSAGGGFSFDCNTGYYINSKFGIGAQFNTFLHKNKKLTTIKFGWNTGSEIIIENPGNWSGTNIALSPRFKFEVKTFRFAVYALAGYMSLKTPRYRYERTNYDTDEYEQIILEDAKTSGVSGGFGIEINHMVGDHFALSTSFSTIISPQSYTAREYRTYSNNFSNSVTITDLKFDPVVTMMNFQFGVGYFF